MQTIPFDTIENSPIDIVGALDFDKRKKGISPRRLPPWTRSQVPEFMNVMVRMPSGVRLAFRTDTTCIRLTVQTARLVVPPLTPPPVAFDLIIDDGEPCTQSHDAGNSLILDPDKPGEFTLERGDAYDVCFDGLDPKEKSCELWLPADVLLEIRSVSIDQGASLKAPRQTDKPLWIHYGSSISHCAEADSPTGTWPSVAARLGKMNLRSFGFGGNCHLDPFVARTIRDQPADLISMKVGINIVNMDSMRERVFSPLLHGFLDTIRESKPDTPILVISPIFCPSAESNPGPTGPGPNGKVATIPGHEEIREGCMSLSRLRELIESVVEIRQKEGDRHLDYLNGLVLFGPGDAADLPDDLHPNSAGYRRIGERFHKAIFAPGGLWHP